MIKWVEISSQSDPIRNDILSKFLNDNGVENTVDYLQVTSAQLKQAILDCQKKYDQIRIHPNFGVESLGLFEGVTSEMLTIGAADCWMKADGSWWPRSYYYKAFHSVIARQGSKLNLDSEVLIIGTGALAKIFMNGFVKLGFKKINISSIMDESAQQFVQSSARFLFDVELSFIPQALLILSYFLSTTRISRKFHF